MQRIVQRLKTQRALVLSGPSGCGKSSLAVAGVAARMDRELLEGTDGWRLIVVRPSETKALELVSPSATKASESKEPLLGTMIVVDQLEEVLNLDTERQQSFCVGLSELASAKRSSDVLVHEHVRITSDTPLRVVATVREDFEWQVARLEALRELCETSRCLVTGVDATSARELVEEPAKALGYRLGGAGAVVNEVEAELAKDATALPIVQFALTEWWARRDKAQKELPAKAWRELGGVEGALSYVADRHYRNLSPADQKILRELFGRLLLGDRKQWVRADSLETTKERHLMDQLADLRLVKRRDEGEGGVGYELAHESLAKRWDTLKQWISERAAEDALIVDVEADAWLWVRQGKPAHRLRMDLVVAPHVRTRLGADALAYVDASNEAKQTAEKAEQRRRRKIYLGAILTLGAALALAILYLAQMSKKEAEIIAALNIAQFENESAKKSLVLAEQAQAKSELAEVAAKDAAAQAYKAKMDVEKERNQRKADFEALEKRITDAKSVKELEAIRKEIANRRATLPDTAPNKGTSSPQPAAPVVEPPW